MGGDPVKKKQKLHVFTISLTASIRYWHCRSSFSRYISSYIMFPSQTLMSLFICDFLFFFLKSTWRFQKKQNNFHEYVDSMKENFSQAIRRHWRTGDGESARGQLRTRLRENARGWRRFVMRPRRFFSYFCLGIEYRSGYRNHFYWSEGILTFT